MGDDVTGFSFNSELAANYESGAQKIRVMSEDWVHRSIFCPCCGTKTLEQYQNNNPAADFYCLACSEDFELKAKGGRLGKKIVDGAYATMIEKIKNKQNPNLFFMTYNSQNLLVENLILVPKHFFTLKTLEKRPPLSSTARRAGWVGCNFLLEELPNSGKIYIVQNQCTRSKTDVMSDWAKTVFLREENTDSKSWLLDVMSCIEKLRRPHFFLSDMYAFESELSLRHPRNKHIQPKIRQQLQTLRDRGYLEFIGSGEYLVL